jgi:hypothetical protein
VEVTFACTVITVCVILHNICEIHHERYSYDWNEQNDEEVDNNQVDDDDFSHCVFQKYNYLKIDNSQVLKKTSEQSTIKCYCYVITDIFCACIYLFMLNFCLILDNDRLFFYRNYMVGEVLFTAKKSIFDVILKAIRANCFSLLGRVVSLVRELIQV